MEGYQKQTFRFLDIDDDELSSIKPDDVSEHEASVPKEIISLSLTTPLANNIINSITDVNSNTMVTSKQSNDIESNVIESQQEYPTRESLQEMKISDSCPALTRDSSQREVIKHDYSITPFHVSVLTSEVPIVTQPSSQGGGIGLEDVCSEGHRLEIFSLWPAFVAMGFTFLFVACCVFVVTYHASK